MIPYQPAEALLDRDLIGPLADLRDESGLAILAGLYESFAGDARRTLQQMRDDVLHGRSALLARAAHRLRGSGGSIGARGFAAECLEIERRARDSGNEFLEGAIDAASCKLEATLAALHSQFGGR